MCRLLPTKTIFVFLTVVVPVKLQCFFAASDHADYKGCWVDDIARKYPFSYTHGMTAYLNMTIDYCILGCADEGFPYAGVEHKYWCFGGNYDPYLTVAAHPNVSDAECNSLCGGNQNQMCGGYWRLAIYKIHNFKSDSMFREYRSVYIGQSITTYPLSTETITGIGMRAITKCAQSCSNTPQCKVFSYSSTSNMCFKFKGAKLCDPPSADWGSTVFYLL